MKIFLNRKPVGGPWGGGNKTIILLTEKLRQRGYEVCFTLNPDVNIIVCIDPRPTDHTFEDFINHRERFGSKIFQRVGDLGLHSKPQLTDLVLKTVPKSDYVTFISTYAFYHIEAYGVSPNICSVDYLAPLKEFYSKRNISMNFNKPIRLVTHHWSPNYKKGWDFYKFLDEHLNFDHFEFMFIGNLPPEIKFKNIKYHTPMTQEQLIDELPRHDIYISGSIEETGGNHVLEAMACGLPVLYHANGGGIKDYCEDYGYEFQSTNGLMDGINLIINNYKMFKERVLTYTATLDNVIERYVEIIERLKEN